MSTSRWAAAASFCLLAAMPMVSNAQTSDTLKTEAQDFVHDILHAFLGPHWNVFAGGGLATDDRFLLQHAPNTVDGERALKTSTGWSVTGGGGFDFLLRQGVRASYTFRSSQLNFKTNNGNGSDALDIDDVGRLKTSTLTLEVMRYIVPARAVVSPYGSLGIQGTWSSLDSKSALVTSNSTTPFTLSPLFAFGVQFKVANHWSGRLEADLMTGSNPFSGKDSFRATSGPTIDEPSNVGHTDFRLAVVYHFTKPNYSMKSVPNTRAQGSPK